MTQLLMRRPSLADLPPIGPMPDGHMLRKYETADLQGLARLLATAFKDEAWTVERVQNWLIDAPDVRETFVVADCANVIATASARLMPDAYPGDGYLHWVAADASQAGRGLGRLVSLAVMHAFVHHGCTGAVLETDDDRLPAIATYLGLGFRPVYRDDTHVARWAKIERKLQERRKPR